MCIDSLLPTLVISQNPFQNCQFSRCAFIFHCVLIFISLVFPHVRTSLGKDLSRSFVDLLISLFGVLWASVWFYNLCVCQCLLKWILLNLVDCNPAAGSSFIILEFISGDSNGSMSYALHDISEVPQTFPVVDKLMYQLLLFDTNFSSVKYA